MDARVTDARIAQTMGALRRGMFFPLFFPPFLFFFSPYHYILSYSQTLEQRRDVRDMAVIYFLPDFFHLSSVLAQLQREQRDRQGRLCCITTPVAVITS